MDNQDALRQATLLFQGLGCPLPWLWEGADNVCGRRRSNEDPLIFWGCKHASGPDWDCSEEKTGEKNFPKMTQKWLLRGHGAEKPLPLSTVTARVDGGLPQFYIVKSFIHKLRGQSLECFFGSIEVLRWTSDMVPFDFTHGVPGMRGVCSAPHDARSEVPCWGANPEQLMILGTATRIYSLYSTLSNLVILVNILYLFWMDCKWGLQLEASLAFWVLGAKLIFKRPGSGHKFHFLLKKHPRMQKLGLKLGCSAVVATPKPQAFVLSRRCEVLVDGANPVTVELLDFERPWKLVLGKRVPGLQLTSLLIETMAFRMLGLLLRIFCFVKMCFEGLCSLLPGTFSFFTCCVCSACRWKHEHHVKETSNQETRRPGWNCHRNPSSYILWMKPTVFKSFFRIPWFHWKFGPIQKQLNPNIFQQECRHYTQRCSPWQRSFLPDRRFEPFNFRGRCVLIH